MVLELPAVADPSKKPPIRRWAVRGLLALWAVGVSVVAMTLTAGHWYTMPAPDPGSPLLKAALVDFSAGNVGEAGRDWTALHVLYAECRCSQRVFAHLLERGVEPNVNEVVVLVGQLPDFTQAAIARGFRVEVVEPEALASRFGIESAPLFVVADGTQRVRYLGGYTARKQGLHIQDVQIMHDLARNTDVGDEMGLAQALPLFGCAVSESLQELIDPLRIKYAKKVR